jgi:uncharacterized membrane protein
MNSKYALLMVTVVLLPLLAHAEAEETGKAPPMLYTIFLSVLPIAVCAVLVWWFFKRFVRKNQKRSDDYIAEQKRHNDRVEQLLERIASAIEKKDAHGG